MPGTRDIVSYRPAPGHFLLCKSPGVPGGGMATSQIDTGKTNSLECIFIGGYVIMFYIFAEFSRLFSGLFYKNSDFPEFSLRFLQFSLSFKGMWPSWSLVFLCFYSKKELTWHMDFSQQFQSLMILVIFVICVICVCKCRKMPGFYSTRQGNSNVKVVNIFARCIAWVPYKPSETENFRFLQNHFAL